MEETIYIPSYEQVSETPVDLALQGIQIDLEKSKTYKWSGAELTQEVGIVVPVVYGRHVIGGNLINAYIEEGENETLNMLVALCEGEIESVTNVRINGTPIEQIYGNNPNDPYGQSAEVTVRYGTTNQLPISGFGDLHNYKTVMEVLKASVPFIYEGVIDDAQGFTVELEIDKLYELDDDQNMLSWYLSVQIEYKLHSDSQWTFMGVYEISKKTSALFKRHIKSPYLPRGRYDIRVMKVSDDSDDFKTFGNVTLLSVDEFVTENLSYPSTALIALRLLAMQNIYQRLPNVTCIVTGRKVRVPKVTYTPGGDDLVDWEDYYYDPTVSPNGSFRTIWNDAIVYWDGETYIDAWSGNPVWCFRDMLINNRFGLGDYISAFDIDETSFLVSALYCEEGVNDLRGRKEKRFRLDIVLDTDYRASDVLSLILQSFRGMFDTSQGVARVSIERQGESVYLFSESNITFGSLNIHYLTNKVSNILSCDFTNKDKDYSRDRIEIGDEESIRRGESLRQGSYQLIGCTRPSQALREGTIQLNKLKVNKVILSFISFIDGVTLQPNDIFEFQHSLPNWGSGGRCKEGSTQSLLKLDKEVTLDFGKTYEVVVKSQTDNLETRVVTNSAGKHTELTLDSNLSFTPKEFDIWAVGIQGQSLQKYRTLTSTKMSDGSVSIQAVNYNPDVYEATSIRLPDDNYIHLDLSIPNVTNVTLRERTSRQPSGAIIIQAEVSFNKPIISGKWVKQATNFEIHISDNDGRSWNKVGLINSEYFLIPETLSKGKLYWVSVVSVAEDGTKNLPSNSPRQSITPIGWTLAPSVVKNVQYRFEDKIEIQWEKNPENDIAFYEVRTQDAGWGENDLYLVFRGLGTNCMILNPIERGGVPFYIRAYNTSSLFSSSSAQVTPQNSPPGSTELSVISLFQKAFVTWIPVDELDIVNYEIWRNSSNSWTGEEFEDETIVGKFDGTSAVLEVPHAQTYFRIRAFDSFGGGAFSEAVVANQVDIVSGDIADNAIRAEHIQADSITARHLSVSSVLAEHISANQITADKMLINDLSAISANLGTVLAGTIIGAVIKTSAQDYRTELNQTGLYSYNDQGNLVIKMVNGSLCFIDPNDSEYYSFIDSGQMKYHTPYGNIPSLKRITSGVATAGSRVTLCQWYERPHILVGLKKLMSYNSSHGESCQEWCVYADAPLFYNNGGGDFGWTFDIHAKLVLSGGTRPENIYCVPFNHTCQTGLCTCQVVVGSEFQVWCHDDAPSNYQYGQVCYEVKYRKLGCGVWCSAPYVYEQPSETVEDLRYKHRVCQTINFGESGVFEVQLNTLSTQYLDSGLEAGSFELRTCCYQYQVDCSFCYSCVAYASKSINYRVVARGEDSTIRRTESQRFDDILNFGSPAGTVINSSLCYHITGGFYGSTGSYTTASGYIQGQYGGGSSYSGGVKNINASQAYSIGAYIPTINFTSCLTASARSRSYTYVSSCTYGYGPGSVTYSTSWIICSSCSAISAYISACANLCLKNCVLCYFWCCYNYKVYCGLANACDHRLFYSMKDITGDECILDPSGDVSYFAVAYS